MAEIQESGDKKGKGSKQKKMSIRVDFTPMVDMNAQQASDYGNQYAFQR